MSGSLPRTACILFGAPQPSGGQHLLFPPSSPPGCEAGTETMEGDGRKRTAAERHPQRSRGADCSLLFCFMSLRSVSACTVTAWLCLSMLLQPWPRSWPFPVTYMPVGVGQPEEP